MGRKGVWMGSGTATHPTPRHGIRLRAGSAGSASGGCSKGSLRCLGSANLPKMKAALYEAMRFKPVGPVSIRQAARGCPAGGFLLPGSDSTGSVRLQAGDTVIVNLAGIHRCPAIFPNPSQFDLANFWPSTAAQLGANFFPFGGGPKGCLGSDLAMLEMQVLTACFLLAFQLQSAGPGSGTAASAPSLDALQSEWQVANQPTERVPLRVRLAPSASAVLPALGGGDMGAAEVSILQHAAGSNGGADE